MTEELEEKIRTIMKWHDSLTGKIPGMCPENKRKKCEKYRIYRCWGLGTYFNEKGEIEECKNHPHFRKKYS